MNTYCRWISVRGDVEIASKLHLALLLLVLLGTQGLVSAMGEFQYRESIRVWVNFYGMTCSVMFNLGFDGVEGPVPASEFLDEPSFMGMTVSIGYHGDGEVTSVSVMLNGSKITEEQGYRIARDLKRKIEKAFNLYLPYKETQGSFDTLYHDFEVEECPPRGEIANLLGNSLTQGFGQVVIPLLTSRNVTVDFWLLESWTSTIRYSHERFNIVLDQEYTISLKEMTGYSGTIRSSPEASHSTLRVNFLIPKGARLEIIEAAPPQMAITQEQTEANLYADVTGLSIDDLSIRFKMVRGELIDPAALGIFLIQAAMICLAAYVFLRNRR